MSDMLHSLSPYIGVLGVVVASLATMGAIGVAFLVSPSRATLYWSFAFALTMMASYGSVAGEAIGSELLRRIAIGGLLGGPALIWSGFRALRGARSFVLAGPVLAVLSSTAFVLIDDPELYSTVSHVGFFTASVFGGLFLLEWWRLDRPRNPWLTPLVVASILLFANGVANLVLGFLLPVGDQLSALRLTAALTLIVYLICAATGIVGISAGQWLRARSSKTTNEWERFAQAATARMLSGQRGAEQLSVLHLQIDDAPEIRQAVGPAALLRLTGNIESAVRAALPDHALSATFSPGAVVAVTANDETAVREMIRSIQLRASNLTVDVRMPIQPSLSIGWAQASNVGYDFETLLYFAREASTVARENGGDRWERVSSRVAQRLLSPQSLR